MMNADCAAPGPSWAKKGHAPFLGEGALQADRQVVANVTPPPQRKGVLTLASLIRPSHIRHARSRESENFYRSGPSKATKFSESVQKEINITNQVSALSLIHRNPGRPPSNYFLQCYLHRIAGFESTMVGILNSILKYHF